MHLHESLNCCELRLSVQCIEVFPGRDERWPVAQQEWQENLCIRHKNIKVGQASIAALKVLWLQVILENYIQISSGYYIF